MGALEPSAGWYPDPWGTGGQRYFDGTDWTGHYSPPGQGQVVVVGTNNTAHAVLSLLTCGAWIPIWIIVAVVESRRVHVQRTT